MPSPESVRLPATQSPAAPYFANYVTNQLVERYGARHVFGGGMKVMTTIDLGLQKLARQAIDKVLPPSIGPSAALVAIDVHTGEVVAMIGGRNYRESQFNLATQGERQPGSAFKPFVLAAALRDGIAPSSTLVSRPLVARCRRSRLERLELRAQQPGADQPLDRARVLRQHRLRAADEPRRPRERRRAPRSRWGSRARSTRTSRSASAPSRRRPLEMARAYATLANGGYRLDSSIFRNEPIAVQSITFPSKDPSKPNAADGQHADRAGDPVADERQRGDRGPDAPGRRPVRHRHRRAASRLAGRRARPGRPRTTATPGSSGSRRTSSSPSGSATRTSSSR